MNPFYYIKKLSFLFILLPITGYFVYHIFHGEKGICAYFKIKDELDTKKYDLQKIELNIKKLQHKVNLLRSESLDLDLLEERARDFLGYIKKNEVVILDEDL